MLDFLKVLIRALVIAIITLFIFIFVILRILARAPGVIVALSIIAIGVFSVALYKGSFSAVGLHTRKSIRLAVIISVCLFILSAAIFIFGFLYD